MVCHHNGCRAQNFSYEVRLDRFKSFSSLFVNGLDNARRVLTHMKNRGVNEG